MIITKSQPYTKEEIQKLQEQFVVYIKTVVDIKREICSAGCNRHFDSEQVLLDSNSRQSDLWGGGVDLETKSIDCSSFINIRPADGNTSSEIQDPQIRKQFERLMRYFFAAVL